MIGSLIRKKADEKGVSINRLEKEAGLRPGSVYNILSGRSKNPGFLIVQSIASALDCSVSEFIEADYTLNDKQQVAKGNRPSWNNDLYFDCMTCLMQMVKDKKIILPREKFIELADEVYFYSTRAGLLNPDKIFIDWILDKMVVFQS